MIPQIYLDGVRFNVTESSDMIDGVRGVDCDVSNVSYDFGQTHSIHKNHHCTISDDLVSEADFCIFHVLFIRRGPKLGSISGM